MMQKILLVEDDITLANWVSEYLTQQNFIVEHVERGDLVMSAIAKSNPDLILLDVMLPGLNGIEVCRLVRQQSAVPIIMLTARADEFDEIIGLEAGANDYVIKPVRPRILLARIQSALRNKISAPLNQYLEFGLLSMDQNSKQVIYKNKEIDL